MEKSTVGGILKKDTNDIRDTLLEGSVLGKDREEIAKALQKLKAGEKQSGAGTTK